MRSKVLGTKSRYRVACVASVGALAIALYSSVAAQSPKPTSSASPISSTSTSSASSTSARVLFDTYCITCHNQRAKVAGLALDVVDVNDVARNADVFEKAVRKLRGGMMPPPGAKRPEQAVVDGVVGSLERALDAAVAAHPNPGRVAVHRLNRAEYANAIDDLLGVRVDPTALLPKDDEADGFDNVASVLTVSPSFLDQYISAARLVTARALGNAVARPGSMTYRPAKGTDQAVHVDGLPLGTRGGLIAEHLFPSDGDYKLNITGLAGAGYVRGVEYKHRLIVTLDGTKVFENTVGGEEDIKAIDQQQAPAVAAINGRFQNIPLKVTAGPHKLGVTFVARTYAESDDVLYSFKPGAGEDRIPRVGSVEIQGPFTNAGLSDTPSRHKIFVCHPTTAAEELPSASASARSRRSSPDLQASEDGCAKQILSTLARRAYRRPVTEQDLSAPMSFFASARASGDFNAGIQAALPAILASPKFLYRAERSPAGLAPGSVHRITDLELASRLSFFLQSRIPDDALLTAAEQKRLADPAVLDAQVTRLLADPRSNTLVTSFAFQWLKMRGVDDIEPDAVIFPNFDDTLRDAFRHEMELFVQAIVREDRSVLDLMTADFTFVNERLALHYGIPNVRGDRFRRVTLTDPNRFGLLGKGGMLLSTSYANRTAPVLRGAWILENILGTPPAAPPPDVEAFQENKDGEKAKTVRAIMEQHRAKPSCNACHGIMDPIGFALENFDAVGAWRATDVWAGTPIDPSSRLVDGTPIGGPLDLRKALMRRPEQFVQTMTEKLMTYALGRSVEYYDMPAVRKIVRDAAADNFRFSSIVKGIVRSQPFQMRRVPEPETPASSTASLR